MTAASIAMLLMSLIFGAGGIYLLFSVWALARFSLGFTGRIIMNDGGWVMVVMILAACVFFWAAHFFWPLTFIVTVDG